MNDFILLYINCDLQKETLVSFVSMCDLYLPLTRMHKGSALQWAGKIREQHEVISQVVR